MKIELSCVGFCQRWLDSLPMRTALQDIFAAACPFSKKHRNGASHISQFLLKSNDCL